MMTLLKGSNFWSIVFFVMLFTVGIDSVFTMQEFTIAYFIDGGYLIFGKMRREIAVAIILFVQFLLAFIFSQRNGFWLFTMFDNYAANQSLMFALLGEVFVVVYVFGLDKIEALLERSTGERIPIFAKIMLKYLTPLLVTAILIASFVREFQKDWSESETWERVFCRFLIFFPIVMAFIGFVVPIKSPKIDDLIVDQYGETLEEIMADPSKAEPAHI